ncbi:MAG TPA: hypothetical protein PKV41_00995 [Candidatus Omnitrophota bacterium]|nr:hypothetical protein [Candidatus Omnitrophota bacterium]
MKTRLLIFLILFVTLNAIGCSQKKEGDEPTKYVSQEGLERLTQQAAQKTQKAAASGGLIENLKFSSFREINPASDALKNLDAAIRPVLVQQFGGAKIIEQNNKSVSESEGDLTLNSMTYVVKGAMNEKNAEQLHGALKAANFKPSIRLGTKPTITRNWAMMSFNKRTAGATYSIVFQIDFKKQTIILKNYQLGSKYDRMM